MTARTEDRDGRRLLIVRDPDAARLASAILALLRAALLRRQR